MRKEGTGYKKIADCLNISINTIKSYCKRNNLSCAAVVTKTEKPLPDKEGLSFCKNCGRSIEQQAGRKPKKFCSDECRMAWWNSNIEKVDKRAVYHLECAGCGKSFDSYGNKNRKYCCHSCYIKDRFYKEERSEEFDDKGTV